MAASQSCLLVGRRGGCLVGLKGKQPILVLREVVLRGPRSRDERLTGCEGATVSGVEVADSARDRQRYRVRYILYGTDHETKRI